MLTLVLAENDPRWQEACRTTKIDGLIIAFEGGLGAGKTSLVRSWLRNMGIEGSIRSPTYTLCEYYYPANKLAIIHIDAYRLEDESAWEMLGLDVFDKASLWIEWCEKHKHMFALCDVRIEINFDHDINHRRYDLTSYTVAGAIWMESL